MTNTVDDQDSTTHARVLQLVVEYGPVTAGELARRLGLTAAAIRRHIVALENTSQIVVHGRGSAPRRGPGRPARYYVATDDGRAALPDAYAQLANHVLRHLAEVAGEESVPGFAEVRASQMEERHRGRIAAAGGHLQDRTRALADALSAEGYAATVRTAGAAGRTHSLQLCQGHCPVQAVAEEFPQICEAETQAISRLLGVHVQRLATLAGGGHACTTHIPIVDVHHAPPTGDDTEGNT